MLSQRMMWIIWPAFLMAGILEMLVFAMVDPQDLHWFGQAIQLSRQGVYTVSFFVFWLITMLSSGLTTLLAISPVNVNRSSQIADDPIEASAGQGSCTTNHSKST